MECRITGEIQELKVIWHKWLGIIVHVNRFHPEDYCLQCFS